MKKKSSRERKLVNLATKKTIHVSMSVSSHAGFRIACFNHDLSMQEVLEEFARLVTIGRPDAIGVLESAASRKLNRQLRQLDEADSDAIYSILELESPLKDAT
jgi:hypothetical protein